MQMFPYTDIYPKSSSCVFLGMRVIELLRVEPHALLELLRFTDIEARHGSVISHYPCENQTLVALVLVLLQNFLVVLLCHIPMDKKGKIITPTNQLPCE